MRVTGVVLAAACGAGVMGCSAARPAQPVAPMVVRLGPQRPRPYPVFEPAAFKRAIANGTRTDSGRPGPRYWQQYARYTIAADLDSATRRLSGQEDAWYFNRSPDTLRLVYVQVYHNLFAPNALRNMEVPVVGPVAFVRVAAEGTELPEGARRNPGFVVHNTSMRIQLPHPLAPGDSARFAFTWNFEVPPDGAPRGGWTDDNTYFLSYWYPQFAVYDDWNGWQTDPYLGNAEFYMGYADYDVSLTVPAGWLVASTGTLQNPDEVLSPKTRERLAASRRTGDIVHVVTDTDRGPGRATTAGTNGTLTWHYTAHDVRDVDWAASPAFLWDATIAVPGGHEPDGAPDTTAIYSFYRTSGLRWHWAESARYNRASIQFLSGFLWPYPYSHMTTVQGPNSCGGMEYPMITCIGGAYGDSTSLYEVIVHELGHMWFPMQVGSDEKRYAWMDEGLTQFDQSQGMAAFFKGYDDEARNRFVYEFMARGGAETPTMRWGDLFPNYDAYGVATYFKTATVLVALRKILGPDLFMRAYREYGRRWIGKHPAPYDFFNTFDDVTGRDLSWFWRTWFFETWTLDQAIGGVRPVGDSLEVTIDDRGLAPMPVLLAVTREGGHVDHLTIPVGVWLAGARSTTVMVAAEPRVTRIVIDPGNAFPDLDRRNQVWTPPVQ